MNVKKIISNLLTAFMAQGVTFLVSLVMSLLVPKVLGIASYGYWQLFVFYISYSGFFQLGLNDGVYLIKGGQNRSEIDKKAINSQFAVAVTLQIAISFFFAICVLLNNVGYERNFVLFSFSVYTILVNVSAFLGYLFQAMNETKLFSISSMLERLVFVVPMLIMVFFKISDFRPFIVFYIIARFCSLLYCCWKARDFFSSGFYSATQSVKLAFTSIKVGFGLMLANVAGMFILGIARFLVDNAWGIEAFGKVSFSLSIVNFFISFVSQASMVLFPALRQGNDSERRSFYRLMRDLMEIAFPFIYIFYFPVSSILSLWLPQYSESMHYFALLLPICVFNTKMDLCCTTYFKVLREEKILLKVNVIAVIGSAFCSFVGVYVLKSLDAVLLGAVICIMLRSLWSEHYLNSKLGFCDSLMPIEEMLLSFVFIFFSLFYNSYIAIGVFCVSYLLFLLINKGVVISVVSSISKKVRYELNHGRHGR